MSEQKSKALFDEGLKNYKDRNYAAALEPFMQAAAMGHKDAISYLGDMYSDGHGVKRNYEMAFEYYHEAAMKGDDHAMYALGVLYDKGNGVEQDYTLALEWYHKAADKGDSFAMYSLGRLYALGNGITQDYDMALEWYHKAADRGSVSAMNEIGICYAEGHGVSKDGQLAIQWFRRAASTGYSVAMRNLGIQYHYGSSNVPVNLADARRWYTKARDKGHPKAEQDLAKLAALEAKEVNTKPLMMIVKLSISIKEQFAEQKQLNTRLGNFVSNDDEIWRCLAAFANSVDKYDQVIDSLKGLLADVAIISQDPKIRAVYDKYELEFALLETEYEMHYKKLKSMDDMFKGSGGFGWKKREAEITQATEAIRLELAAAATGWQNKLRKLLSSLAAESHSRHFENLGKVFFEFYGPAMALLELSVYVYKAMLFEDNKAGRYKTLFKELNTAGIHCANGMVDLLLFQQLFTYTLIESVQIDYDEANCGKLDSGVLVRILNSFRDSVSTANSMLELAETCQIGIEQRTLSKITSACQVIPFDGEKIGPVCQSFSLRLMITSYDICAIILETAHHVIGTIAASKERWSSSQSADVSSYLANASKQMNELQQKWAAQMLCINRGCASEDDAVRSYIETTLGTWVENACEYINILEKCVGAYEQSIRNKQKATAAKFLLGATVLVGACASAAIPSKYEVTYSDGVNTWKQTEFR